MSTELSTVVKLYNKYLKSAKPLMQYKGSGGLYSTSDDALVLIMRNRIFCELQLLDGKLIRKVFPKGKDAMSITLDPTVDNLKKSLKRMLAFRHAV